MTVLFAGMALVERFEVTPADVCYLSMPLFHSNALLAGWGVAVGSGATMAPAAFSASGLIDDLRRYGATYMNYVGKPLAYVLATPEHPDDADNPLRVAFGNEASDRDIAEFGRRFGCTVWDGFGSTEGAVIVTREDNCPPGSVGKGFPGVAIYDPDTLAECPIGRIRRHRRADQRRQGHRRTGQHHRGRVVPGLLQGRIGDRRPAAQRHVLVRRSGLPGCRRLDLPGRPHRGLDAGRRREHDRGARSSGSCCATTPSTGSRCIRCPTSTWATRSWPPSCCATVPSSPPPSSASSWPPSPTCRRRPGRAMSGSPTTCPSTATNKVLKRELIAMGARPGGLVCGGPATRRRRRPPAGSARVPPE